MLYQLLVTLYAFTCLFLILIILVQKGKGSMGIGGLGGGTQMLFGGGGGQDIFQKVTWFLGAIFMFGSLILAFMKVYQAQTFRYVTPKAPQMQLPTAPTPGPQMPTTPQEPASS